MVKFFMHNNIVPLNFVSTHSGGIELIFKGSNLNVVQNPVLVINDPDYLDNVNVSSDYICI